MKNIILKLLIILFITSCISFLNIEKEVIVKAESNEVFRNAYYDDSTLEECSLDEIKKLYRTENFIEHEIEHGFYFKNFDLEYEYNHIGTCAIVSLSMLLCYYDTFYNDNIVKDTITYVDINGIEKNIETMKNGEFSDCLDYRYSQASLGPTDDFHDYLFDLMLKYDIKSLVPECDSNGNYLYDDNGNIRYVTGGLTQFEMNSIFEKYCIENDIDSNLLSFNFNVNLTGIQLLNLLDNGVPLELGISNYAYLYTHGGEPKGFKRVNGEHSVVCYGYVETDNGIYLKVHMGYDNDEDTDNMNEFYMDINSVVSYSYYSFASNSNHVCSSNYVYKNIDNSEFTIEICPCRDLSYYFNHELVLNSLNMLVHKFTCKSNNNFSIVQDHINHYENNQLTTHIKKCIYFDFCNIIDVEEHDFNNNVINIAYDINGGHYYYCVDCKISKLIEHTNEIETFNNQQHRYLCTICDFGYVEDHLSIYNGNIDDHYRSCNVCNGTFEDDHILNYNEYSLTLHQIDCSCGFVEYENHDYNENFTCNYCDFVHSAHYYYDYDKVNNLVHYKKCLCGYVESERHIFIDYLGGSKCTLCGYITNGGVVLNSKGENETNLKVDNINVFYTKKEEEFIEEVK